MINKETNKKGNIKISVADFQQLVLQAGLQLWVPGARGVLTAPHGAGLPPGGSLWVPSRLPDGGTGPRCLL